MTLETFTVNFFKRFPEMNNAMNDFYSCIADGDRIDFCWHISVVIPIMILFDKENSVEKNADLFQKIFNFFEEMTYSNDVNVVNLLMDYTFEPFTCDFNKYGGIKKFLGKRSMILYRIACQTTYPPLEEFDEIGPAYLKHYYAEGEQSWGNCYLDFIDEWVRKSEEEKSKDKEEKLD